jgi:hypothetical protein
MGNASTAEHAEIAENYRFPFADSAVSAVDAVLPRLFTLADRMCATRVSPVLTFSGN